MSATNISEMLKFIDPARLDYREWIEVGMALKAEGQSLEVWDKWSAQDPRHKPDDCSSRWNGFASTGITGATITHLAKKGGWTPEPKIWIPRGEERAIGFDDDLETEGLTTIDPTVPLYSDPAQQATEFLKHAFKSGELVNVVTSAKWDEQRSKWFPTIDPTVPLYSDPAQQATEFLKHAFKSGELVNVVTSAKWDEQRSKWFPNNSGFSQERDAIIKRLENGLDGFAGDRNTAAGVWIRANPVDGNGVKNDNVTAFRHVLVESDDMDLDKQVEIYKRLELPITCLTLSAGKSVHALVKVDAQNAEEYRERVTRIFQACADQGLTIDRQNRNPSRLTRFAGFERGEKQQSLIAVEIGQKSYEDWSKNFVLDELDRQNRNPSRLTRFAGFERGEKQQSLIAVEIGQKSYEDWSKNFVLDELPEYENLTDLFANPPELPPETIRGVLRKGEKLVLTGPSKAGKSFALIQLAVCLATGSWWLGRFKCSQQRVVYINLELTKENSAIRLLNVWKELRRDDKTGMENLSIWNLRGSTVTTKAMVDSIIKRHKAMANPPDYYIVDPIYKINAGDENAAKDTNELLREFDRLCAQANANLVYAHHHAKGSQFGKRALDRGSGSGVIGRDADAAIDLDFLFVPESIRKKKAEYYKDDSQFGKRALDRGSGSGVIGRDADAAIDLDFLFVPESIRKKKAEYYKDDSWLKATGLRVEMTLRNFESKPPFNVWFKYPVHIWDNADDFQSLKGEGEKAPLDKAEDGKANKKVDTDNEIKTEIERQIKESGAAQIGTVEKNVTPTRNTINRFLKDHSDEYQKDEKGKIIRVSKT